MELIDVIHQIGEQGMKASQPTDVAIGTVVATDPIEISINTEMAPLRQEVLYFTSAVVEKKISSLAHSHTINGLTHYHTYNDNPTTQNLSGSYKTNSGLGGIACVENGEPLSVSGGYITLNKGLEKGDKVLLLRVQNGQKFIVLSRIF